MNSYLINIAGNLCKQALSPSERRTLARAISQPKMARDDIDSDKLTQIKEWLDGLDTDTLRLIYTNLRSRFEVGEDSVAPSIVPKTAMDQRAWGKKYGEAFVKSMARTKPAAARPVAADSNYDSQFPNAARLKTSMGGAEPLPAKHSAMAVSSAPSFNERFPDGARLKK